jgi:hypothetical protein
MFSKATELALKAQKVYLDNENWRCYWHGLSGDELKTQIFTVANKQTDKMISYAFSDISAKYKESEVLGLNELLVKDFEVKVDECLPCTIEFLNDAKIEYTGSPYIKETQ